MICPRCDTEDVEFLVKSPVGDAWELYICNSCAYSWRSTETPDKTDPKMYNRSFKIKAEEIPNMMVLPPYPSK
jgi:vanillate/4-hydroxybenzoate decarboxylase subunit D